MVRSLRCSSKKLLPMRTCANQLLASWANGLINIWHLFESSLLIQKTRLQKTRLQQKSAGALACACALSCVIGLKQSQSSPDCIDIKSDDLDEIEAQTLARKSETAHKQNTKKKIHENTATSQGLTDWTYAKIIALASEHKSSAQTRLRFVLRAAATKEGCEIVRNDFDIKYSTFCLAVFWTDSSFFHLNKNNICFATFHLITHHW